MSRKNKRRKDSYCGFSLLELIVVLAGLGILSSLTLPNISRLLESVNVDEVKTLLNSAAADCLQKIRSEDDPIIDTEIISNGIVNRLGYEIDEANTIVDENDIPKCSYILLKPKNNDDRARYSIGFSLLPNGKLDKLAGTENKNLEADCIKWAGKCSISPCAKKLGDYKDEIRASREACNSRLAEWKTTMNPERYQQWDPTSGPDSCPLTPPPEDENGQCDESYKGTDNCTTGGCDRPIWGLWNDEEDKGTTYNSETAYETAREILIGEKCAKQIKEEYEDTGFTNPDSNGIPLTECRDTNYWFIDGESQGSAAKWEEGMCKKNKQNLLGTTHNGPVNYCGLEPIYICGGEEIKGENAEANFNSCVASDKNAICTMELNADALEKGDGGPYTSPTPNNMAAPIGDDCNTQYWYCEGKIYKDEDEYTANESCQNKVCELAPGMGYCDRSDFYGYPGCTAYQKCMGYIE